MLKIKRYAYSQNFQLCKYLNTSIPSTLTSSYFTFLRCDAIDGKNVWMDFAIILRKGSMWDENKKNWQPWYHIIKCYESVVIIFLLFWSIGILQTWNPQHKADHVHIQIRVHVDADDTSDNVLAQFLRLVTPVIYISSYSSLSPHFSVGRAWPPKSHWLSTSPSFTRFELALHSLYSFSSLNLSAQP